MFSCDDARFEQGTLSLRSNRRTFHSGIDLIFNYEFIKTESSDRWLHFRLHGHGLRALWSSLTHLLKQKCNSELCLGT